MPTIGPPVDIMAAVATYIQGAMGESLASATGYPQVYADYLPQQNPDGSAVTPSFAMVTEGPETYLAQSEDHASTGFWLSNIADGIALVHFFAETKAQARALCRAAVHLMTDSEFNFDAGDARTVTLMPIRSETAMQLSVGVAGESQVFQRTLTVSYKQQFLE